MPSPVVEITGLKELPTYPLEGKLEISGWVGVAGPTVNVWGEPSADVKNVPAAKWASSVHRPWALNETMPPLTEQTSTVSEDIDVFPSPFVATTGVKLPPNTGLAGTFEIVGAFGTAG